MKVALAFLMLCAVATAIRNTENLPPGFSSASDLAQVLANEPASAARFVESHLASDVISFREDAPLASNNCGSSCVTNTNDGASDEESEYDAQIAQVQEDIKKVKASIKETQECAHHLTEQQAELRSLQEQRDNLEKEKQKRALQAKLEQQMKDLTEINKMSRSLRSKFTELKRTQDLIQTKLTGTKSSLNQLDDSHSDLTMGDLNESTENINNEVQAMHEAQNALLDSSHKANSKEVKTEINLANKLNLEAREKAALHKRGGSSNSE